VDLYSLENMLAVLVEKRIVEKIIRLTAITIPVIGAAAATKIKLEFLLSNS